MLLLSKSHLCCLCAYEEDACWAAKLELEEDTHHHLLRHPLGEARPVPNDSMTLLAVQDLPEKPPKDLVLVRHQQPQPSPSPRQHQLCPRFHAQHPPRSLHAKNWCSFAGLNCYETFYEQLEQPPHQDPQGLVKSSEKRTNRIRSEKIKGDQKVAQQQPSLLSAPEQRER